MTPHYRIEHPATGMALHFKCAPAPARDAPRIITALVAPARATRFLSRAGAIEHCTRYLTGEPVDIVRVDA
jgi:hypothetical protein